MSEISKTVFKIFLAQISRKLELVHLTVSDRQKRREPAEMFKINKQDAYVLSEISKTVFKIFLAQISRKLQI